MTLRIVLWIVLAVFLLCLLFGAVRFSQAEDVEGIETVGARHPSYPTWVGEEPTTTTTTVVARARTAPTVRSASVGRPAIAESSIRGFPCGGDLPPCKVLRRESMMAVDPPRVWNGNCYMPAGSLGQCGRSTASGLWQALRSTWNRFGGYVNAADAPVDVQNAFARMLWAGGRGCSHWAAC